MTQNIERRCCAAEVRVEVAADKPQTIRGYAAVYGKESADMGFIETIARGAFKNVLTRGPDTRALINHQGGLTTIGRTTNGTLTLSEDDNGLQYVVQPPDTTAGRDIVTLVERGDINQSSFAFTVAEGGDSWTEKDGVLHRTITEIGELLDVSPVTFPAYDDTTVAVRKMEQFKEAHKPAPAPKPVDLHEFKNRQLKAEL